MADAASPDTMSLREFARHIDRRPSYITNLKNQQRLVLTPAGRVVVEASKRLIAETMDPSRAAVAARHATTRAATGQGAPIGTASPQPTATAADTADEPPSSFVPNDPHAKRRAKALADQAEAQARKALRDEQVELGNLLQRDDVVPVVAGAVVAFRTSLENLSAALAPQFAAISDEARCKVLLDSSIEHALEELSRQFAAIGREG